MNCDQKGSPVTVLVICPTRELALQVAAEATKLLKHHPSIGAQVVIGGACLTLERKLLKEKPCQVKFSYVFIACRGMKFFLSECQ